MRSRPRPEASGGTGDRARGIWPFVLRFALPHRRLLLLAVLLLPAITAAQQLQPYLFKLAIDGPIRDQAAAGLPVRAETVLGLLRLSALYLATLVTAFGLEYLLTYLMELAGQRVVYDMRMSMFTHVQRLDLAFFERNAVGTLLTRVTNDLEGISEFFSAGLISLIGDLFQLAGILTAMCLLSWKLTLLTFTVAPPLLLVAFLFRVRLRRVYLEIRKRIARINATLSETINGVDTVKVFTRAERNDAEFEALNRAYMRANLRAIFYDASLYAIVEMISAVAIGIFVYSSGMSITRGAITLGTVVAFVEYIKRFFVPIRDIGMKYSIVQSAYASADRIQGLLMERSRLARPEHPVPLVRPGGRVEFRHVTFGYRQGEPVLRDVSFVLEPGRSLAVVGATGAGKSTLLKLINRFYDPWEGAVLLDGVDVRRYELRALRQRIGQVLQDVILFAGTVADNIRLDRDLPPERVEEVARQAQVHALVERLPEGYETPIRERGANISHGERQLIAFARVLAKDPEVFLFDEATSNIDSETEARIQRALALLLRDRTSLIVAHRLSTVTAADGILVMHKGEVAEAGDHDTLMRLDGIYAKLYRLQFSDSRADG